MVAENEPKTSAEAKGACSKDGQKAYCCALGAVS